MDQDQVSDTVAATSDYAYARELVQTYFAMLTTQALSASEAAIKSIYFATMAPVSLCIEMALDQQQDKILSTPETSELPQHEEVKVTPTPEPQEEEENQTEDTSQSSTADNNAGKEELHPETSDEVPKIQQPEKVSVPTTTSPKSTPRRRLTVAVQLDNGINKNHELPVKRPTVITRVAVQPKQKPDIQVSACLPVTEPVDTPEQQQHAKVASKPVKGTRQRLLSRPKKKLFDAIKRSFSRSKKTPLGSA